VLLDTAIDAARVWFRVNLELVMPSSSRIAALHDLTVPTTDTFDLGNDFVVHAGEIHDSVLIPMLICVGKQAGVTPVRG